jgi:hypothetical protein
MRKTMAVAVRIGRATALFLGLAVMLAATFGVATTALAGTGVGAAFNLGATNTVNALSSLVGSTAGPMLKVDNNGTGSALQLEANAGKSPLTVNADAGKATNLNADKLDGKDSSGFYAVGSKVADADKLDGKDSADFARASRQTVVVAPIGTAQENGTALSNALGGITDASEAKPYLLKLEPGVYDLGTGTLNMKPFVDVEGAGQNVTKITSSGPAGADHNTLTGANNAELRFVTVENRGGGDYATAIRNDYASPNITHVTAHASGGVQGSRGIVNASASPKLSETTVQATGASGKKTGIQNYNSTLAIEDTDITVTGSGGEKRGIENIDGAGGDDFLTLANVNVSVSEGSGDNYGMSDFDYQVRAKDLRISVTGGGSNFGVHTRDGVGGFDLLDLQNMNVSVTGGTSNIGIHNGDTDMEIGNSRIEADGGTSIGVRAQEPGVGKYDDVRIDNSVVRGATKTVEGSGGANVKIGASRLQGGPATGVNACAGVYDENYAFSTNSCPQ